MFCLLLLVSGPLLSLSVAQAEKRHLYVKPTPTSSGCPQDEVCMTLSHYLQSVSDYFTSNTTIHFLPGNHTISEPNNELVAISNVQNLSLSGSINAKGTILYCAKRLGFAFVNVTNLTFFNIRISNCGEIVNNLLNFNLEMHPETKVALVLVNIHSLTLQKVQIEASYGYGLLVINVFSDSTVADCHFTHNMWRSDDSIIANKSDTENRPGGNALFVFSSHELQLCNVTLVISHCLFAYGVDATIYDSEQSQIRGGSGLGIFMVYSHYKTFEFNVKVIDSVFNRNTVLHGAGANMFVAIHVDGIFSRLLSVVHINNCTFYDGSAVEGGGMFVRSISRNIEGIQFVFILSNSTVVNNSAKSGGGLCINTTRVDVRGKSFFTIENSVFHSNRALWGAAVYIADSVRWRYEYSSWPYLPPYSERIVRLLNSAITTNSAKSRGGGLLIKVSQMDTPDKSFFEIKNCVFTNNNALQGAGICISGYVQWKAKKWPESQIPITPFTDPRYINGPIININISNTVFLQNTARYGGGMNINFIYTVRYREESVAGSVNITCTRCHFTENKAISGCAMSISGSNIDPINSPFHYTIQRHKISLQLFNAGVKNNAIQKFHKRGDHCGAVLCIQNAVEILLSNSSFMGNNGSAVYVNGSKLFISGVVNVMDNHGVSGGGLSFDCNPRSFLHLTPHSQLYVANNTASLHGGAIAARDCSAQTDSASECFIQMYDENSECKYPRWKTKILTVNNSIACYDSKVIMHDNTAVIAGDSIYGGALETCYILLDAGDENRKINFNRIRTSIFEIRNTWSISEITSDPFQVCFCDKNFNINTSNCVTETQAEVYHGQTLRIPAVGVGQFNNTSPSVIRTRVAYSTSEFSFGERQTVQELDRDCGLLTYLFKSSGNGNYTVDLHVTVETASTKNSSFPAIVHVTVTECPPGFEFSKDLSMCDCEPHLRRQTIRCDIDSQKVFRRATTWIGYYQRPLVVIHTNCPFHYCKPEDVGFQLDNQDDQCAFNHSGVLCGACQQGLSLALGTSQCLKCSNVYLLLIIPFALAGVALVFLLLKCNLTVSVGSINGLIFYANIIQVNHATFFPQETEGMNLLTKFLSVFIAWLNLDFGIQTCFFTDMTAYIKTWLQFVFPAYVWIMVGFMIYGSRHYPTVSRLIGSNAVQVLATLFLLSYAKLLRTVIAASYSTALTGRNSSTPLVWLLDGNVPFFRGAHIALLLMALVVILVYIIPFTILLLLSPCLQSTSNHRILRLVNIKLKPLLDAYQGPYRDRFRYWTGLMLLVRVALFAVFAGNVFGKPEINLFAVIVSILLFYWNAGRVYKRALWNITESFYLLNLAVLSAATSLIRSLEVPRSQEIVTDIMVGTAFAVFCAVILYHFCVYLLKSSVVRINIKQTLRKLLRQDRQQPTANPITNPNTSGVPSSTHTVSYINIELNQLREPLLSGTN